LKDCETEATDHKKHSNTWISICPERRLYIIGRNSNEVLMKPVQATLESVKLSWLVASRTPSGDNGFMV